MRILVSCANGSGTSLMMMKSVEKAMKELSVPITKIHHCALSEGKSSATQYDVVFTPVNFLNMFDQAVKKGVTVIGIKNVMSPKEISEKFAESELYQKMDK
ncbi:PTS sugar transporter subunit IIB [Enterococcus pallens]|uniref:PTS system ascorbate-specific transporter subunit IIB n=1 Tax=Enterococcus pallens ATCC BAA-351 TaxID=1158607 RepID=R2T399_9ENTE|nr:PTS sugar transporter subunit IIB [Enterococcus pallens]EOH94734.1 PTS system ascorbate-specific transporter subunit IIB [Enterococcus pallens ATCC BAA-351]EOU14947.1 PTS system ascorbate-specific transporter subunit IIB [Enterococcus pallens ATCC BAA-351]OJG78206.1 PTS system ascorbate-specific transporter subunit IIB [Enterococcus pallens]